MCLTQPIGIWIRPLLKGPFKLAQTHSGILTGTPYLGAHFWANRPAGRHSFAIDTVCRVDWRCGSSFDAFVEDLEAVADRLELKRFPLLAFRRVVCGCQLIRGCAIQKACFRPLICCRWLCCGWRHYRPCRKTGHGGEKPSWPLIPKPWLGGTDYPSIQAIFSQDLSWPDADCAELTMVLDEFSGGVRPTSPAKPPAFKEVRCAGSTCGTG